MHLQTAFNGGGGAGGGGALCLGQSEESHLALLGAGRLCRDREPVTPHRDIGRVDSLGNFL